MHRLLWISLSTVLLLSACIVAPPRHPGSELRIAPALPLVVELGAEPYYYQNGYYYFYANDRWGYSTTRNGPWSDLPRDRYPREIRYQYQNRPGARDHGRKNERYRDDYEYSYPHDSH